MGPRLLNCFYISTEGAHDLRNSENTVSIVRKGKRLQPKPSLKIRTASATFGTDRSMLRENGLKNIFLRNKTFLFFKIES